MYGDTPARTDLKIGHYNTAVTSPGRSRGWVCRLGRLWLSSWLLRISWRGCLLYWIPGTRSRGICLRAGDFVRRGFRLRRSDRRRALPWRGFMRQDYAQTNIDSELCVAAGAGYLKSAIWFLRHERILPLFWRKAVSRAALTDAVHGLRRIAALRTVCRRRRRRRHGSGNADDTTD